MNNCEYCGGQFSANGLTAHRRRCKRAKPEERRDRLNRGGWRAKPERRSSLIIAGGLRSQRLAIANWKMSQA